MPGTLPGTSGRQVPDQGRELVPGRSPDDKLSPVQRSVLLILMAEAREVPNAYLKDVCRIEVKKKEHRDPLERQGLITVRQQRRGGPLTLELTERGWGWAREEFGTEVPARAGSYGAAMYRILAGLEQFFTRTGYSPATVFGTSGADDPAARPTAAAYRGPAGTAPEPTGASEPDAGPAWSSAGAHQPAEVEAMIRKAYGDLAGAPGEPIALTRLRAALGPLTRDEVDAALIRMNRSPDVQLSREINLKALSHDLHAGALSLGNQDVHLIAIDA